MRLELERRMLAKGCGTVYMEMKTGKWSMIRVPAKERPVEKREQH